MVLDASLLNTQHYNVRIKSKWSNPGKVEAPSPTPRCSSYWKRNIRVLLDYGRPTYSLIYLGNLRMVKYRRNNALNFTFYIKDVTVRGLCYLFEVKEPILCVYQEGIVFCLCVWISYKIYWYISSSCRAISTDIPDPLSAHVPIVHRFRQVLWATPRILTELLCVGSSWSPCFCSAMWRGP